MAKRKEKREKKSRNKLILPTEKLVDDEEVSEEIAKKNISKAQSRQVKRKK